MADWQKLFNEETYNRGIDYYNNGQVREIAIQEDGEHFNAEVKGNSPYFYRVSGRVRNESTVSELKCTCPWAKKGHRCKHEVAALLALVMGDATKIENNVKIADDLPSKVKEVISTYKNDSKLLKTIYDREYTQEIIDSANQLFSRLNVSNYYFQKYEYNLYVFKLELENGFLKFNVSIKFDQNKIFAIDVKTPMKNFQPEALEIIGLFNFIMLFLKDNPLSGTNNAAQRLLDRFDEKDNDENPIILRAQLEMDYVQDPELKFKIGEAGHLYKVKDINNIVNMARMNSKLSLGKFFERKLDINLMDNSSKMWFDFLANFVDINDATSENSHYDYFYSNDVEIISLSNSLVDQIDDMLKNGAEIYSNNKRIKRIENDEKVNFSIATESNKQISVRIGDPIDPSEAIAGVKNYYSYNPDTAIWTKYTNLNPEKLKKIGIEFGDFLEFGSDSISKFGHQILPVIKEVDNFKISGEAALEQVLPPEAKIIYRLDYQDNDLICIPTVSYGKTEFSLNKKSADTTVVRECEKEAAAEKLLADLGFIKDKNNYNLSIGSSDKIDYFFDEGINELKSIGKVQATAAFKRLLGNLKSNFQLSLGIRLGENTLKLELSGEELSSEDIQAILNAYQEKRHYFLLKNGQLQSLESPSLDELDRIMSAMGVSLKKFVKGKMAIPVYRAFYLQKLLDRRNELEFTSNDAFKKFIADIEGAGLKKTPIPKSVASTLRSYQKLGFEWMSQLLEYNLGALLADEMGLGKTLQTISVILARYKKTKLPSLIIVPASVVYNWESELHKFAPELQVATLGGSKKQRKEVLEEANKYQVLITSYDSLKRDLELYQDLNFDLEVIDEAQNIKNARSAASKAVKVIQASHRIALTGTPIENNLSELWSIFDYLMPGFLGNYTYFKDIYEKPIVKENSTATQTQLNEIVAPFILRRLKKDVLQDLPDKSEEVVYVKMSGKQAELYQAKTQNLLNKLHNSDDKDFKKQRLQVLAEITKLRELCCDPHLLYDDYRGKSAKLTATINLVEDLITDDHKILLFSQFTSMLAIIKEKLEKSGVYVFEITGSTLKQKRQELIKEFNELSHPAVFLISLKAGGTGINLTSADTVIHYDPWWNVAAENQATDRAHRIGQKNSVQIYKMVAQGTIEEKILELQNRKEELAEAVLGGEKFSSTSIDKDDLMNILSR